MATIKKVGYGQVEPNHLSAQRTAQIYAQLPAAEEIEILENGQFVKYDYANGVVNFTGAGEWMMVFNEVKLYDDKWRESYKDFAMKKENYTPATYTAYKSPEDFENYLAVLENPESTQEAIDAAFTAATQQEGPADRVNMPTLAGQMVPRVIKINVGDIFTTTAFVDGAYEKGATLDVDTATGYLKAGNGSFQVVAITKMADGNDALKVMKIK